MSWTPTIRTLADGEGATAANINRAVNDLASRTTWLRTQLESLAVGESLVLQDRSVGASVENGQPVYLDGEGVFQPAVVEVDETNLSLMGERTRWQGIATNVSALSADIVIGGQATLLPAVWAAQTEGGSFVPGDIFLSAVTPGMLTTDPGSTGVYIGHLDADGRMMVRASSTGTFVDHVHIQRQMVGDPADDSPADPALGDPHLITNPDPGLRGWLPANATYFPGFVSGVQIPTGAVFGYNIQHPDEQALRAVFPMIPEDNAQLYQSVILTEAHVVVNAYGIWWMTNAYGEAPWPVDYVSGPTPATDIRLWTARLTGGSSLFEAIAQRITQQLSTNAQQFAVTQLQSTNNEVLQVTGPENPRGPLSLSPRGVNYARTGRGLRASAALGNATAGWRGDVLFENAIEMPAVHVWTELADIGDKLLPVSTNGFSAGADIGVRAHRLGSDPADFIDFLLTAGNDLPAATDYRPIVRVQATVDVPAAPPTIANVEVRLYVLSVGSPVSSAAFVRTEQASFTVGQPGRLQQSDLGPFVDVNLRRNNQLLVRIAPSSGGAPVPGDSLRVLSVYGGLVNA